MTVEHDKVYGFLSIFFYLVFLYFIASDVRFPSFYHFVTADEIVAVIAKL